MPQTQHPQKVTSLFSPSPPLALMCRVESGDHRALEMEFFSRPWGMGQVWTEGSEYSAPYFLPMGPGNLALSRHMYSQSLSTVLVTPMNTSVRGH